MQSLEGTDVSKVSHTKGDYRDVELKEGDVVYCDIPYENTRQDGYQGKFNKQEFVEWAQKQDVPVFVSEYTMPEGWTEIASFDVRGVREGKRPEKLWVQDKFADQYFEEKAKEESQEEGETMFSADGQLKPIGKGIFGNIYDQFKGKVKEAFDFLVKNKGGDLLGVFHRDEIGDIDLVWGNHAEHQGLEHMIIDHIIDANDFDSVEEMMQVIDDVIKNGTKEKRRKSEDKVRYEKDGYIVSVRKQFRDEKGNVLFKKNWVITAFESTRKEHEKKRTKEEAEAKWKEIFGDKKRTSPKGTLTTPPSNPEAGGVTLPPSDALSEGKDNANTSYLQENEDISSANTEERETNFSVDEDEAGLSHVKKYVQSIIVPKQITSLAQAAQWTYNALGRIKGMLNRLYSERGSKDFSMGLLSTDPDKGREMDIDKAMYSRGRVKQYLDFVQQVVDFRS